MGAWVKEYPWVCHGVQDIGQKSLAIHTQAVAALMTMDSEFRVHMGTQGFNIPNPETLYQSRGHTLRKRGSMCR